MLGTLLCVGSGSVLLDPYGSTISETTSEAWSVEVLPSDSGRFMLDVVGYLPPYLPCTYVICSKHFQELLRGAVGVVLPVVREAPACDNALPRLNFYC